MSSTVESQTQRNATNLLYASCPEHDVLAKFTVDAQQFYLVLVVLSAFATSATVLTNLTIVTAMSINRRRLTTGQRLLVVLSGVDLLQGVSIWPLNTYFHKLQLDGAVDCALLNITVFTGFGLGWSAVVAIFLITLEQYLAIVFPYHYKRSVTFLKLVLPLLVSTIINVIASVVLIVWLNQNRYWVIYKVSIATGSFIFAGIIIILQGHVAYIANRTRKRIGQHNPSEGQDIQRRAKAMKTSLSIISAFLIAYAPFAVYYAYTAISKDISLITRTYVRPVVESFALSNSMVNPVLCYWRSSFVRRAVRQLICK